MANLEILRNFDPDLEYFNTENESTNHNTEYVQMDTYNALLAKHALSFIIMNFNIRSFNKNIDFFNAFLGTFDKQRLNVVPLKLLPQLLKAL